MRNLALFVIGLGLAIVPEHTALAQYAATQDSTLRGLGKVHVVFAGLAREFPGPVAQRFYDTATLELRKAGLRVVRNPTELDMAQDGILNISLLRVGGACCWLRIDVEQQARLARTQQMLQMVTWFYEGYPSSTAVTVGARERVASDLLTKGLNQLLSKWLEANGR